MMGPLTIIQEDNFVNVEQGFPTLTIQQVLVPVFIEGNVNMTNNFIPFSFPTTQGQTVFGPLPAVPLAIWVFLTGTAQNQANGDFTVQGANIVLSQGASQYDTALYGVIQIS